MKTITDHADYKHLHTDIEHHLRMGEIVFVEQLQREIGDTRFESLAKQYGYDLIIHPDGRKCAFKRQVSN